MATVQIRTANKADIDQIYDYIVELAVYEKEPDAVKTTPQALSDALFGEQAKAYGLICEVDEKIAGYAIYFYNFSTWLGQYGIYLEDLYISPDFRGCGAGKALLKHLAEKAVAENCGRFEWSVLDWNKPSIDFYESFGAKPQDEWVGYRLTGDALKDFAAS
ncbi:GNAT family N-acetyltransferase [Oceanospirillum maris]|jgi:GNAT superfamily N-acetyltransferase|uniref:GNAT family N-acetyltransferase n=1 Tax=Oceanospirillum maris TaxID=64977 RepID=UPI0004023892|nr:GNAT family N-acetyltransferase [Oceanospirillum maris]